MAPVATSTDKVQESTAPVKPVQATKVFNPFYSPPGGDDGDETYKYAEFKVCIILIADFLLYVSY